MKPSKPSELSEDGLSIQQTQQANYFIHRCPLSSYGSFEEFGPTPVSTKSTHTSVPAEIQFLSYICSRNAPTQKMNLLS